MSSVALGSSSIPVAQHIDGQTDQVLTSSTAQQSLNVENIQENIISDTTNSEQHTTSFPHTDRP